MSELPFQENEERVARLDGLDHPHLGQVRKVIDLAAIDQNDFDVRARGGVVLVTPRKTKHTWQAHELHLRSLVCTPEGTVLSSGWPKFVNYGEDASIDREVERRMSAGEMELAPKLDGSLIILDVIDGGVFLRTRGSHELGDFQEPVVRLFREKYPQVGEALTDPAQQPFFAQHSLLFEYTSPENQIVLKYDEPALTLLGYVDKGTLRPRWDSFTMTRLSRLFGMEWARPYGFPVDAKAIAAEIRGMQGIEGFVVRSTCGEPLIVKMKTEEYLTLHSVKFGFTPRKAAKLSYLLDIDSADELQGVLEAHGIDAEGVEVLRPMVEEYLQRRDAARSAFATWCGLLTEWSREVADRKHYVEVVRAALSEGDESWRFPVAMKVRDGKQREALRIVDAWVLDESESVLRGWEANTASELGSLFRQPQVEVD